MPSTNETNTAGYPVEIFLGILFISILVGVVAWDEVVAIFFFALSTLIYLQYRTLRAVELIAAKS